MNTIKKLTDRELLEHTLASLVWLNRRIDRMEHLLERQYNEKYKDSNPQETYWTLAPELLDSFKELLETRNEIKTQQINLKQKSSN